MNYKKWKGTYNIYLLMKVRVRPVKGGCCMFIIVSLLPSLLYHLKFMYLLCSYGIQLFIATELLLVIELLLHCPKLTNSWSFIKYLKFGWSTEQHRSVHLYAGTQTQFSAKSKQEDRLCNFIFQQPPSWL